MPDNQDRDGDHEPDRVRFTPVATAGVFGVFLKFATSVSAACTFALEPVRP